MEVCESGNLSGAAEEARGEFAELNLQHDLSLALSAQTEWGAVAEMLRRAGAQVEALQITRFAATLTARCRLLGITPASARALVAQLLDAGLADRGRVEHVAVRGADQGAA